MTQTNPYLDKAAALRTLLEAEAARGAETPLLELIERAIELHVFVGTAQAALQEGRDYTNTQSRPWIYSGVERHANDPWIQREYGQLKIQLVAAAALADTAAAALDAALQTGNTLTPAGLDRVSAAVTIAHVYASETGLAVTSTFFELMGARSATKTNGFDRFWRTLRSETLNRPAENLAIEIGASFLGADPLSTPPTAEGI